jgi:hypothetical protein
MANNIWNRRGQSRMKNPEKLATLGTQRHRGMDNPETLATLGTQFKSFCLDSITYMANNIWPIMDDQKQAKIQELYRLV